MCNKVFRVLSIDSRSRVTLHRPSPYVRGYFVTFEGKKIYHPYKLYWRI